MSAATPEIVELNARAREAWGELREVVRAVAERRAKRRALLARQATQPADRKLRRVEGYRCAAGHKTEWTPCLECALTGGLPELSPVAVAQLLDQRGAGYHAAETPSGRAHAPGCLRPGAEIDAALAARIFTLFRGRWTARRIADHLGISEHVCRRAYVADWISRHATQLLNSCVGRQLRGNRAQLTGWEVLDEFERRVNRGENAKNLAVRCAAPRKLLRMAGLWPAGELAADPLDEIADVG